jgi:hypothetical protein
MPDMSPAADRYNPNFLLDALLDTLNLKNDAALSRKLDISAPIICKIRRGYLPISASVLIRIHEETGMQINELRGLMGDRRARYRMSKAQRRTSMPQ